MPPTSSAGRARRAGRCSNELLAFATAPRFVYVHKWRLGDLVIWDNRCTLHRASPFASNEHMRELHRTTIIDTRGDAVAA